MATIMPTLSLTLVLLPLLLLLQHPSPTHAAQNPCHKKKGTLGDNVTCEKAILPPALCTSCKLRKTTKNGHFKDCADIYDVRAPRCLAELKRYAALNAGCDPVRARQVQDVSVEENRSGLDYFVYSVCEQCCDCVPRGSTRSQFKTRRTARLLMKADRGNCPAHAVYDICKVWPQIRYVTGPGWKSVPRRKPKICPQLRAWRQRKENRKWLYKDTVKISADIRRFFNRFFNVARCKRWEVWLPCVTLETKQKRL